MSFPDNDYMLEPEYTPEQQKVLDLFDSIDNIVALTCKLELRKWKDVRFEKLPDDVLFQYVEKYGIK